MNKIFTPSGDGDWERGIDGDSLLGGSERPVLRIHVHDQTRVQLEKSDFGKKK